MNILIVDDHPLFREGLGLILARHEPSCCILESGDFASAFNAMDQRSEIDLVLLDLVVPDMNGLAALQVMRRRWPHVPVVVLSAVTDRSTVLAAINGGAMGFIPKSSNSMVLAQALRLVLAGQVYVPLATDSPLVEGAGQQAPSVERRAAALRDAGITGRQLDVLGLMVKGLPNKLIARQLGIGEATVKSHVTACLRTLAVDNRTQAVLAMGRMGWDSE